MNYHALITQCEDYIKKNIASEITAQNLADHCGYSLYHLSSVFRACFGCSVGRYITEERLRLAARMIQDGKKITEVAMESGFDTSSGFTKAFRRQFGCTPREYRRRAPVLPEFVKRSALKAYGYVIPVHEEQEEAGQAAFWSQIRFRDYPPYPEDASDYAEIGIWINPDKKTGMMDYFFGYVTNDASPAEGFRPISIDAGVYAVFRLAYPPADTDLKQTLPLSIQAMWQFIFQEWLEESISPDFDDSRLCFEKYGSESAEIWVPIK